MNQMSKAFVKESDGDDDEVGNEPEIPQGVKNYITPHGARKLQEELRHLKYDLRPEITKMVTWAAENGDRSENADYQYNKKKLRDIDKRMRFLGKRLDSVEVIDPLLHKEKGSDQIFFGATVVIRDEDRSEKTYSIVGLDEIDMEKGRISWISPLASALLKARVGDYVSFKSPKGLREIEVVEIRYEELL